jgi:hypothetical protein
MPDDPDDEAASDLDLDPPPFLAPLGINVEECAEYVQQTTHQYDSEL